MIKTLLAAAATLVAIPAIAAPNLVTNGSFETTTVGTNHQVVGTADLPGWTIDNSISRYVYVSDANAATAYPFSYDGGGGPGPDDRRLAASFPGVSPDGGNFLGFDGDQTYGSPITQTINGLVVGKQYTVSFDWAATQLRNRTGDTTNQFIVSLGGDTQSTPVVGVVGQGFQGWYKQSFTYTATATSEVLEFLANGAPAGLPPFALLDGISLTGSVPEPAAWVLMIAGFGLVGVAARRRRVSVAA